MKDNKDDNKQLIALQKEQKGIEKIAADLVITDESTKSIAEDFLKQVAKFRKSVEAQYSTWLGPIEEHVKNKKAERDAIFNSVDKAIKDVKAKYAKFFEEARKIQEEAAATINAKLLNDTKKDKAKEVAKLIKEGNVEEAQTLAEAPLPVIQYVSESPTSGEGVSVSGRLDFHVDALNKIPDFYFKPRKLDTKKIRQAGHAGKKIPGVTFYRKASVAVRS